MFHRKREQFEIYNDVWLDIIVSDNIEMLNEEFGHHKNWYACVFKNNFVNNPDDKDEALKRSIVIVLNPNHPTGVMDYSVIVHEIVHIKNQLFKYIGYKNSVRNDEHESYFIEYLFNTVRAFYDEVYEKENIKYPR